VLTVNTPRPGWKLRSRKQEGELIPGLPQNQTSFNQAFATNVISRTTSIVGPGVSSMSGDVNLDDKNELGLLVGSLRAAEVEAI
jgi:hypothetical protein